jgi:nitrogen fixation NifU-like protein
LIVLQFSKLLRASFLNGLPMYSSQVLDHFHHPRNVGEIPEAAFVVETTNPACGDLMKLWAVVSDGVVVDAKFKVAGCVPAVACGSWLTERIKGKPVKELAGIMPDQIGASLGGLPAASQHAAVLASDALKHLLARLPQA